MIDKSQQHLIDPLVGFICEITGETQVRLISIVPEDQPDQGASGGEVNQYTVGYTLDNGSVIHTIQVVDKQATLFERRVVNLLSKQKQAIPSVYITDLESDSRQAIFMQYAKRRPLEQIDGNMFNPTTRPIANGLAKIHAANRTYCPVWLPKVADHIMHELYLHETQIVWDRCLQKNDFHAEFGMYDKRLKQALEDFLKLIQHLTDEGDTLTLINSDLHPDHIRLLADAQPVFIDWEQACYGSFYLDLVNYFSIETALVYRDALADTGYEIPAAAFMERFRAAGHFMGLRYLEVGLLAWQAGGDIWQQGRWFFHYCLTLALQGR